MSPSLTQLDETTFVNTVYFFHIGNIKPFFTIN